MKLVEASAYELALPETAKSHPVVHVSQLKQDLRAGEIALMELPFTT